MTNLTGAAKTAPDAPSPGGRFTRVRVLFGLLATVAVAGAATIGITSSASAEGQGIIAPDVVVRTADTPDPVLAGRKVGYQITFSISDIGVAVLGKLRVAYPESYIFLDGESDGLCDNENDRPNQPVGTNSIVCDFGLVQLPLIDRQANLRFRTQSPGRMQIASTAEVSLLPETFVADNTDIEETLVDVPVSARCFGQDPTLVGSSGVDTFRGTPGNDVISTIAGNDVVDGGGGDDLICTGGGDDRVIGGAGNDRINTSTNSDLINGDSGNDEIKGGPGVDKVRGDAGDDRLAGGSGNDRISGADGDDHLNGGTGKDRCSGGPGNNTEKKCDDGGTKRSSRRSRGSRRGRG